MTALLEVQSDLVQELKNLYAHSYDFNPDVLEKCQGLHAMITERFEIIRSAGIKKPVLRSKTKVPDDSPANHIPIKKPKDMSTSGSSEVIKSITGPLPLAINNSNDWDQNRESGVPRRIVLRDLTTSEVSLQANKEQPVVVSADVQSNLISSPSPSPDSSPKREWKKWVAGLPPSLAVKIENSGVKVESVKEKSVIDGMAKSFDKKSSKQELTNELQAQLEGIDWTEDEENLAINVNPNNKSSNQLTKELEDLVQGIDWSNEW